ncbi:MAG: hypothetical protein GC145_03480 [Caulobacter sp.]|nr:hypothetical protein [Caulobacter sp.]
MTAFQSFQRNYGDVQVLFEVHGTLTEGVQGRNRLMTPAVLKSGIVLMCAAWEAFVEDACVEGAQLVSEQLQNPNNLPAGVKRKIASKLETDKHDLASWQLAGEGWRELYRVEVARLCDGLAGGLNTPNTANVKALYKDVFGLADASANWGWQGMTPERAARKLNDLVRLRGELAHGRGAGGLNIGTVQGHAAHIERLVTQLQASTNDAIVRILAA